MGTVIVDEVYAVTLQPEAAGSLTVGLVEFPGSDSTSRATASFGGTPSFKSKSIYQNVTTATATINPDTSIIGVDFDGKVVLTLPVNVTNFNEISIVDEGGFCNALNTITATSPGALGSLVLSSPYAHLKSRNNGNVWISEAKDTSVVIPIPAV